MSTIENRLSGKIGIYMWTSPSGKSYIGQSKDLGSRHKDFRCASVNRTYAGSNSIIDKARQKYPYEDWEYKVLEFCKEEELGERETYWISYYDTIKKGYNITKGGLGGCGIPKSAFKKGHKNSPEMYEKAKETLKKHIEEGVIDFSDRSKRVAIYYLDGSLFNVFNSYKEAGRELGVSNIGPSIRYNYTILKKYFAKEVDGDVLLFVEPFKKNKRVMSAEAKKKMSDKKRGIKYPTMWRPVYGIRESDGQIFHFNSITEAAEFANPNNPKTGGKNIGDNLKGNRRIAYGYFWYYENPTA